MLWTIVFNISKIEFLSIFSSKSSILSTNIVPSVIVPVLSIHNVSTRASVSKEYISWTKTRFLAKTPTPVNKVVENKRYIPLGIKEIKLPPIGPIMTSETNWKSFKLLAFFTSKIIVCNPPMIPATMQRTSKIKFISVFNFVFGCLNSLVLFSMFAI